jgi:guanylate kinase
MNRLIVLSGPSCVGKSPLDRALKRFYPELRKSMQTLVLYNSREPRPGEVDGEDYHFRSREFIAQLKHREGHAVMEVRGDLQALDQAELVRQLGRGDVIFEGNPFIGDWLLQHARQTGTGHLGVFMSPLCREEVEHFKKQQGSGGLEALITDMMRRKLLRRTRRQKGELSLKDLQNIETRAASAYPELQLAHRFGFVLPNSDGEDSENWDAFYYPVGSARRCMLAFIDLLQGRTPVLAEQWDQQLLA